MANPFLVLGGIAVGIITAGFGILQVPGWVASAQDASAQNDIAQVSILQSASLSKLGVVQADIENTVDAANQPVDLGVIATTDNEPKVAVNGKSYAVVVESKSGKAFLRVDGGAITEHATVAAAKTAATGFTFAD